LFIVSAGGILLFTGFAKLISTFGNQKILDVTDPIFGLSFRCVILIVGILELIVSGVCLLTIKRNLSQILIAWMATSFLLYRLGLWFIGWHHPCPCLGNFYDAIHLSPRIADLVNKSVLAYLLVGSYWLICLKFFKSLIKTKQI